MKVYAIPGLGTNGSIFNHLNIEHELIIIKWIEPKAQETLPAYAIRLIDQIDQSTPFALLGVSFGGMLVTEIAKYVIAERIILISSASGHKELPWIATVSRYTKLDKIIPAFIYKPPVWVSYLVFFNNKENRKIAQKIIRSMNTHFVKWAIGAIVNWKNDIVPQMVFRIHGRLDPIIPLRKKMNAEVIGKGHFIILKNADEISSKINEITEI